ncbi:MAG TPA: hypothetical protein VMO78_01770 [Rhizomicrobium sp.]|nr:hypothetical protein [Rhizomicrobium sp.]
MHKELSNGGKGNIGRIGSRTGSCPRRLVHRQTGNEAEEEKSKECGEKDGQESQESQEADPEGQKTREEGQEESQALIISHLRQVWGVFPCRKDASSF